MGRITCALLAAIVGIAAFRKFDFETLRFENTGLGILYVAAFVFFVVVAVRSKGDAEKSEK
ncbi:hypothetical protein E5K00_13940 [Hymenobacter aquaticus]|uniref:Uncharacterized protein n=1 Tax=Hymenobacter aquaticus TaxID=1867101 RepID=A0A4Z0PVU6_9BACT|nr:hypothetical protein E5K00_13940 [Hymenobacter aquaticus]